MGKASRVKRRAIQAPARRARRSFVWYAALGVVLALGVAGIVVSRSRPAGGDRPRANFDHWHAALGVNICGKWTAPAPEFHNAAGTQVQAGVHSHGDGLMHIHPYTTEESGKRATVGLFMRNGGWDVAQDSLRIWEGNPMKSGDKCPSGKVGQVRWSVNGKEKEGDPGAYHPEDQDVIAIAFLPEGAKIGTPPSKESLKAPNDVEPTAPTPTTAAAGAVTTAAAGAVTTVPAGAVTTVAP